MIKNLIIIRGKSGSGKSSLAKYIQSLDPTSIICEADHYFYDANGNYNFNPAKIHLAHKECQEKFKRALESGVTAIVSNTSTKRSERDFYLNAAKEKGYRVFSIVIENLGTKDIHGLPLEVLTRQKETLKNNIDL